MLVVGDVGYRVSTPGGLFAGQNYELDVITVVRENAIDLYGFTEPAQAEMFELLLKVSGVGAKTALACLAHLEVSQLVQAVLDSDVSAFKPVPGIGPKVATTLVNSVTVPEHLRDLADAAGSPTSPVEDGSLLALTGLGYPEASAARALQEIRAGGDDLSEAAELRAAIRLLAA